MSCKLNDLPCVSAVAIYLSHQAGLIGINDIHMSRMDAKCMYSIRNFRLRMFLCLITLTFGQ